MVVVSQWIHPQRLSLYSRQSTTATVLLVVKTYLQHQDSTASTSSTMTSDHLPHLTVLTVLIQPRSTCIWCTTQPVQSSTIQLALQTLVCQDQVTWQSHLSTVQSYKTLSTLTTQVQE